MTRVAVVAGFFALALTPWAESQGPKAGPRLEPIAETKLLMEGLAHANFKGLERLLRQAPTEPTHWTFARGQSLLIAETGNLLMLRPPKAQGVEAWFEKATDLRARAGALAKSLGEKDYHASRAAFVQLANSCNRCHQTFRVQIQIEPFADAPSAP